MKAASSRSDSNMSEQAKAFTVASVILMAALLIGAFSFGLSAGRSNAPMNQVEASAVPEKTRFILKEYTGVGSGVYKHGTIVQVVDGQPKVVGNFNDETGKLSAGTVELVEVK